MNTIPTILFDSVMDLVVEKVVSSEKPISLIKATSIYYIVIQWMQFHNLKTLH